MSSLRSVVRAIAVVVLTALPAVAAPQIVVNAQFVERLPSLPALATRLAPALDATRALNGRFMGFTVPDGLAVIDLPTGLDLLGANNILSDPVRFSGLAPLGGQAVEAANELIVMYRPGMVISSLPPLIAGFTVKRRYQRGNFVVLAATGPIDRARLDALLSDTRVRFVEPNYRYRLTGNKPPDDPDWVNDAVGLWGLRRIGAAQAWRGVHVSQVKVAIIDSGIDLSHPDLSANLPQNLAELNGMTDVDDDHNGCVDDFIGCDFVDAYPPQDTNSHGTQVSGVIAAVGNNGIGTVGVVWSIPILPVRIFQSETADADVAVLAIDYAVASGAKIINASWSGQNSQSAALSDAITRADTAGVLLVASTGNDAANLDIPIQAEYPAAYAHQNIVAVLATDDQDQAASATGIGAVAVDLGAPGSDIQTTTLGAQYRSKFGTSFAVPHVSGALALTWAADPTLSAHAVRQRVLDHVETVVGLSGKCATGGLLNLRFLAPPPQRPPAPTLLNVGPQP